MAFLVDCPNLSCFKFLIATLEGSRLVLAWWLNRVGHRGPLISDAEG
jgi:hypothetical protein